MTLEKIPTFQDVKDWVNGRVTQSADNLSGLDDTVQNLDNDKLESSNYNPVSDVNEEIDNAASSIASLDDQVQTVEDSVELNSLTKLSKTNKYTDSEAADAARFRQTTSELSTFIGSNDFQNNGVNEPFLIKNILTSTTTLDVLDGNSSAAQAVAESSVATDIITKDPNTLDFIPKFTTINTQLLATQNFPPKLFQNGKTKKYIDSSIEYSGSNLNRGGSINYKSDRIDFKGDVSGDDDPTVTVKIETKGEVDLSSFSTLTVDWNYDIRRNPDASFDSFANIRILHSGTKIFEDSVPDGSSKHTFSGVKNLDVSGINSVDNLLFRAKSLEYGEGGYVEGDINNFYLS